MRLSLKSMDVGDSFVCSKLEIGHDHETDKVRIHRFTTSVEVTDLENAGKRGKKVNVLVLLADVERLKDQEKTDFDTLLDEINKVQNFKEAEKLVLDFFEKYDKIYGVSIHRREMRGVDVAPPGHNEIAVSGKGLKVTSHPINGFSIRDTQDVNEETLIPAHSTWKTDSAMFYRWLRDNAEKVKNMDFQDVRKTLDSLKINYHQYCALD